MTGYYLYQQLFTILLSTVFVLLVQLSGTISYSLQLSGLLFIIYLITHYRSRSSEFNHISKLIDIFIFTSITLLLVNSTGGIYSPLFFLIYFLLFGISLIGSPTTSTVLSVLLIAYFILSFFLSRQQLSQQPPLDSIMEPHAQSPLSLIQRPDGANIPYQKTNSSASKTSGFLGTGIKLLSLPLITPLAVYFGKEHRRIYRQKKRLDSLENQSLLWLTTEFRSHLSGIKEAIQNLDFTIKQRLNNPTDWKRLKHQVKRLETMAERLKEHLEKTGGITLFIFAFIFGILHPFSILAQETLESERFRLEINPFTESEQIEATTQEKKEKLKTGEVKETFAAKRVMVKTGLPHTTGTKPFFLNLSPASIDYGPLLPQKPVIKQGSISLELGSAMGYSLYAYQDHPLTTNHGDIINNTSCDSPSKTCTPYHTDVWKSRSSYGFGFNVSADDAIDFNDKYHFRPFATKSFNEDPALIMKTLNATGIRKGNISYKILIGINQPGGFYTNTIYFVAIPRY